MTAHQTTPVAVESPSVTDACWSDLLHITMFVKGNRSYKKMKHRCETNVDGSDIALPYVVNGQSVLIRYTELVILEGNELQFYRIEFVFVFTIFK